MGINEQTKKEFNKVRDIVLELLAEDVRCRNDDKWLTYRVMRHFTNIYIKFEDFEKLPAFETIKRARAKIQNIEGKYLPTEETILKRRARARSVREWVGPH